MDNDLHLTGFPVQEVQLEAVRQCFQVQGDCGEEAQSLHPGVVLHQFTLQELPQHQGKHTKIIAGTTNTNLNLCVQCD